MSERLIVAFIGHPGAGKTKSAKYVANEYGMLVYSPGEYIRAEAAKRGLTILTRAEGMRFVHQTLEAESGPDALINPVLQSEHDVVIDALRRMYDLRRLRSSAAKFILIALTAPIEKQHARVIVDKERVSKGGIDFGTFVADAAAEAFNANPMEPSVNEVIAQADFTIENVGPEADLYCSIDEIMQANGVERASQQR